MNTSSLRYPAPRALQAAVLSALVTCAVVTTSCQSDDSTSPITKVPDASLDHTSSASEGGSEAGRLDGEAPEAAAVVDSGAADAPSGVSDAQGD